MIPAWLLRVLPQIGIALAVLAGGWWIHHDGYRAAMSARDARDARLLEAMREDLRGTEQRLAVAVDGVAGDYQRQRDALTRAGTTLQPIIVKESAHDSRLTDPAAGLTPGLLDAINNARAAGACTAAAAGRIACALPGAARSDGDGNR